VYPLVARLVFIAIVAGLTSPAAAQTPAARARLGLDTGQFFELAGTCALDLTPVKAVIVGGVAAGALKPAEALEQLEKQLEAIRAHVEGQGGHLRLLERVRTLRTPSPRASDREPPFVVVQRLRAEFVASAPVDTILQRMIELGLDRFGDNVLADSGSRRDTVIRFTIGDLGAKLSDLQQRCTVAAWQSWCATSAAAGTCPAQPPPTLQLQMLTVRSEEKLLRPDGGADYWRLNVNRVQQAVDAPELLGNVTVHLIGTISLLYRNDATP